MTQVRRFQPSHRPLRDERTDVREEQSLQRIRRAPIHRRHRHRFPLLDVRAHLSSSGTAAVDVTSRLERASVVVSRPSSSRVRVSTDATDVHERQFSPSPSLVLAVRSFVPSSVDVPPRARPSHDDATRRRRFRGRPTERSIDGGVHRTRSMPSIDRSRGGSIDRCRRSIATTDGGSFVRGGLGFGHRPSRDASSVRSL